MFPEPSRYDSRVPVIYPLVINSNEDNPIDVEKIQQMASTGLDTFPDIDRFYCWLVLLGIFPNQFTKWADTLRELKAQYDDYVNFTNLGNWHKEYILPNTTIDDFQENHALGIIHLDIVRSGRLFYFLPPRPIKNVTIKVPEEDILFEFQEHLRRLERILHTFRVLHSGLGYMQGFNEITIIIYYVLSKPWVTIEKTISDEALDIVECLTFHCFQKLMTVTQLPEFYTTQDESSIIMHKLKTFDSLIAIHLPYAHDVISSLGIHPIFYCLRWFTLLFAQEHDLPSLLMIWDSIFAHFKDLTDYLFYVGLGHLKMIESKLDKNQYSTTIEILQHMKLSGKVKPILSFANQCWEMDRGTKKQ
ncbi:TBC1 domain protein [Histomonas meleagridis]|uniref:TBC1 domain protein n=1 Tax=Histomonas meleagridis TaxID=135588 RepID=UPI003559D2F8|nr:TBC1 domain protein [Histomonas meleagridis]KAH0796923.1 TBC1 domain protein [Histomonas meleagridis]